MKILVPVDSPEQAAVLAKAGATEFYCGFLSKQWMKNYSKPVISDISIQIAPNRRVARASNLETLEDMKTLVDESHRLSIPIYLAVNNPCCVEENYPTLIDEICSLSEIGIDGLIMSDPGLIVTVVSLNLGLKILLSTLTQVANVEGARFFQDLGVSCINFPRFVTLEEIAQITNQLPEMEFECFIMEDRCTYDDGNCNFYHCTKDFFCEEHWFFDYAPATLSPLSYEEYQALKLHEEHYKEWIMPYPNLEVRKGDWQNIGCGICAIPFLMQRTRITGLKIASRGARIEQKLKALWLVSEAIRLTREGAGLEQIREMARDAQFHPELCDLRYRCYFPEPFDV